MNLFLAVLPFLSLLLLIVLLRWPAYRAAWLLVVLIGAGLSLTPGGWPFHHSVNSVLRFGATGIASAVSVLVIVVPALIWYAVLSATGALTTLASWLHRLLPVREYRVLFLVLGLSPLMESLCGFGVGMVVIAPLLQTLELDARTVALLCLVGQLTVAWGVMGTSLQVMASSSSLPAPAIGSLTALLLLPVLMGMSLLPLWLCGGFRTVRRLWWLATLAGVGLCGGFIVWAHFFGEIELAGAGAALLVMGWLIVSCWFSYQRRHAAHQAACRVAPIATPPHPAEVWRASAPLLFVVTMLAVTRLIAPLRHLLQQVGVVNIPVLLVSLPLFYNAGFWLLIATLLGAWLGRLSPVAVVQSLWAARTRLTTTSLTMLGLLTLASLLQHSGMTATLANTLTPLGSRALWAVPWLAALGGWMTGSVLGGDSLFAGVQMTLASHCGLPLVWVIAAQSSAGFLGRLASPTCLLLATTAAGDGTRANTLLLTWGRVVLWGLLVVSSLLAMLVMPSWLALSGTLVLLVVAGSKLFGVSVVRRRPVSDEPFRLTPVTYRCGCGFASCNPHTTLLHAQRAFHCES